MRGISTYFVLLILAVFTTQTVAVVNKQVWSVQAVEGQNFTITCESNPDRGEPKAESGDTIMWKKHGHSDTIVNSHHHSLVQMDNITNFGLRFTPVTSQSAGIYFCHVTKVSGQTGKVVRGINVGGPLYATLSDKYETPIIKGVVGGLGTMVILCALWFVERFRFLTPEQKQKRKTRKEERLAKLKRIESGGVENYGMDATDDQDIKVNGEPLADDNTATRL